MLVKDEADVIEHTVRHLLHEVDQVFVTDNLSTDGTTEILHALRAEHGTSRLQVGLDEEVGYYQSRKTTELAARARHYRHNWVVPVDADEVWYSPFGRLADVLDGLDRRFFQFAAGAILNHVTSGDDDQAELDPARRIGYRLKDPGVLPKVACRASKDLVIGMGNHDAVTSGSVSSVGSPTVEGLIYIHHFPWRSEEQFLRKITNGARAYAEAPELQPSFGSHWRQFGMPGDDGFEERVRGWFREWGYRERPWVDGHPGGDLVYDPAP